MILFAIILWYHDTLDTLPEVDASGCVLMNLSPTNIYQNMLLSESYRENIQALFGLYRHAWVKPSIQLKMASWDLHIFAMAF